MSFQDLAIGSVQQQDLLVTFGALVGSTAVVKTFDTLADKGLIEQNLSRKLIHTTCGPLFILSWLFFTQSQYAKLLSAVIHFLNGLRLFLIGNGALVDAAAVKAVSRKGDRTELLKGPFYYTIILTISTIVFWRDPTGIVALSVMCGGDGLADIVGRRLGQNNKLPYNPSKSVAGSTAMFLGSFLLSEFLLSAFTQFGFLDCMNAETTTRVLIICGISTVLESLPINKIIDDNISVPVAALLLGYALF